MESTVGQGTARTLKMRNAEDKITVEYHIFGKSKLSTACEKCCGGRGGQKAASSRQERPKRKRRLQPRDWRLRTVDDGGLRRQRGNANCMGKMFL